MPRHYFAPPEQAVDGNWAPHVADHPYEGPTHPSPYPPPPIAVSYQPTGMNPRLDPGSGGGPTYYPGEAGYAQVPVSLADTGGLDSSTEANQFTLLRSPYTTDSRGKLFHEQPAESNRIDIDKREIASEFHNQLKSFAGNLKECKTRYEWSNKPEHRQLFKAFIDQGAIVNTSVQEHFNASDGASRAIHFHDDGTPTQEVWYAFMRNFLRDDNQLQTTQDLMRHMDQWIYYYEADCSFAPKPFTFLGRDLGVYGLMNNLLDCADTVFGRHSPTTRPVRDFTRNLGQVADEVKRIREHESLLEIEEISRRFPRAGRIFNVLIDKREIFYTRTRDLITVCEAHVPTPWRDEGGSLTRDASLNFMEALLGPNRLFRALDDLRWDMVEWLERFDEDCAPILKKMRDERQRMLDDDRRRRIEEHERREERARRREGRGYGRRHD